MRVIINAIFICFISLGMMRCTTDQPIDVSTVQEYSTWLNQKENGYIQEKEAGGMILQVKYLPATYLALKEFETKKGMLSFDSLLSAYKYSTTFLLSFRPKDAEKGEDVMLKDVTDYSEYVERSMTLNFDLESRLELKTSTDNYKPVLSSLENTYGLSKGRSIYMVFTAKTQRDELQKASYYDLVYTDDIYNLGILHFMFDLPAMQKHEPQIKLHHS
ncbi:MAG: hypothetical protein JST26_10290 [Bacteroidetes bacterium]|nr:hypothetical protein [Bacteroidota bacterium]